MPGGICFPEMRTCDDLEDDARDVCDAIISSDNNAPPGAIRLAPAIAGGIGAVRDDLRAGRVSKITDHVPVLNPAHEPHQDDIVIERANQLLDLLGEADGIGPDCAKRLHGFIRATLAPSS